jgi:DNA primase
MLYGLSEVRSAIRKQNRVVVVEGEFDMIGSYLAGVRETVAIKGSALTADQVELLRRLTPNLILALDADDAGSEATKRGIMMADSLGMNLSVVEVVGGKDPADLTADKPEEWRKLIEKPVSVYDFLIDKAFSKYKAATGDGKKAISRELSPMLAKITNAVEREYYLAKVAEKLKVPKRALEDEVVKIEVAGEAKGKPEEKTVKSAVSRRVAVERFTLGCFLHLSDRLAEPARKLPVEWLSDQGLNKLWGKILKQVERQPKWQIREIVPSLPMESQRLIQELLVPEVVMGDEEREGVLKLFEKGRRELSLMVDKDKLAVITKKMAGEVLDDETKESLQAEYARLTKSLKENRGGRE